MNETVTQKIRTYGCLNCSYYQDFDPSDVVNVSQNFPELPDLPINTCPACYARRDQDGNRVVSGLHPIIEPQETQSQMTVMSDSDIAAKQVPELDQNGQPVMIQTGERYELRVNQSTGEIYSEVVPVYEPKMRELTSQEIVELKEQRDRNLDELEKMVL